MGYYIVYLNKTVRGKKLKIGILVAMEEEKKRFLNTFGKNEKSILNDRVLKYNGCKKI